jgi:hypothetical protein
VAPVMTYVLPFNFSSIPIHSIGSVIYPQVTVILGSLPLPKG